MTFDDVHELATSLPNVTVATRWGNRTWVVGKASFAWQRPFSKADLARFGDETPPSGEILAVRVENLDAKEALLAIAPRGFFTIPHFQGHAAILIALRVARARDVRAAVLDAYATVAPSDPPRARRRKPGRGRKRDRRPGAGSAVVARREVPTAARRGRSAAGRRCTGAPSPRRGSR